METLKALEFDRRGENPNNKFVGEVDKVTPECNWVIPNASPFFADSVTVYNEKGAELKLGRDYFLDGGIVPLIELAGRNIVSFVKLSDAVMKTNKTIKVDYQSIGVQNIPRNNLEEWLEQLKKGKVPVDWITQVFGKPDKYVPSLHWHSIKTEIGDWDELGWFFNYLATVRKDRDLTLEPKITALLDTSYEKLNKTFKDTLAVIWAHDENYSNPHKIVAGDLVLGNVANMATGTEQDHLDNKPNMLATPHGAKSLIRDFKFDTDSLLRTGTMPISSYGNGNYIPPLIDGSFEGLGARFEAAGMCMEADGRLVVLGNQFDGRIDDLYYTVVDNYKAGNAINNFTAYRYENESLKGFGVRPNYVIGGSGNELLFVGNLTDQANAYICLTNGTFDPSKHNFNKVDISEITTGPYRSANTSNMNTGSVLLMGAWVYFVTRRDIAGGEATGARMYRFPTADLVPGKIPRFECMRISFTTMDDIPFADALDFCFARSKMITNPDGTTDEEFYYRFTPKPDSWSSYGWRALRVWCAEVPGSNKLRYALRFRIYCTWRYQFPGSNTSNVFSNVLDVAYHFDPETGHMERKAMCPKLHIDFAAMGPTGVANATKGQNLFTGPFHHTMAYGSTLATEDGQIFGTFTDDAKSYPRYVYQIDCKQKTRYDTCMTMFNLVDTPDIKDKRIGFKLISPLPSGIYQHMVLFDPDGEYYSARRGRDSDRIWFYRKVKGDWIEREGITNITLPNLKARPLTMSVYATDIPVQYTLSTLTGDAESLSAAGVEMGSMSYSTLALRNGVEFYNQGKWDKHVDGVFYSFPRTMSKEFDEGNKTMKHVVETYYSIDEDFSAKLYKLIDYPEGYGDHVAVLTIMQQPEDGGMFNAINFAHLSLHMVHPTENFTNMYLYTLRMDIEGPGTDHPNSYKLKGFTVISRVFQERVIKDITGRGFGPLIVDYHANIMGYRVGDDIRWIWRTGVSRANIGNNVFQMAQYVTTLSGEIKESSLYNNGWNMSAPSSFCLPKVGMVSGSSFNGGAALTASIAEGNYLMSSVYPEVGWVLFFQEGTQVIFNGTDYLMPSGSVDLRDIDRSPLNKTYYVYATVEADTPKYMISSIRMRHSPYMILAAIVKTSEKQIISIDRYQRFMIGNYLLQSDREGGTIPVSIGLPMDEGKLIYVRRDELT